jgi:DNA-binding response OmpR family regulator
VAERILVINDTKEILELFQTILTDEGYEVLLGTFGVNDLDVVQQANADLVILDYTVHREDLGWQLLQKMKMCRDTDSIPVLICSTDMKIAEERQAFLASKGIDILPKPFNIDELIDAVKKAFDQSDDADSPKRENQ